MGYCCKICKSVKNDGEKYYPVLDTDGAYEPTCSIACAEKMKIKIIRKAIAELDMVKNYKLESDIW